MIRPFAWSVGDNDDGASALEKPSDDESIEARQVASENMDAAESAMDDADFVFDVAQLTRARVLAHRTNCQSKTKTGHSDHGLSFLP